MTHVRATSILAYRDTAAYRETLQGRVLATLDRLGPATNLELSRLLGKEINSITPATNALVKAGLARERQRRPCSITNRKAIEWEAVPSKPAQGTLGV